MEPLKTVLERAGASVVLTEDGHKAVEYIESGQHEMECMVLDMTMPKMSGTEVFHEVRARRPDLPIVIMSGFSESAIQSSFAGSSVSGIAQKPFTPRELVEVVSGAMAGAG